LERGKVVRRSIEHRPKLRSSGEEEVLDGRSIPNREQTLRNEPNNRSNHITVEPLHGVHGPCERGTVPDERL
jgi:hypothetical protein